LTRSHSPSTSLRYQIHPNKTPRCTYLPLCCSLQQQLKPTARFHSPTRLPQTDKADTFPRLVVNGKAEEKDWSATRVTKNRDSKQGVESATSGDIRCYQSANAANVMTVPAGATIHYISTQQVNHPGPTQYYIAKVPSGASVTSWDGSGAVWAKISTTKPAMDANKQLMWPAQSSYLQ
jgi:hypothetical protein